MPFRPLLTRHMYLCLLALMLGHRLKLDLLLSFLSIEAEPAERPDKPEHKPEAPMAPEEAGGIGAELNPSSPPSSVSASTSISASASAGSKTEGVQSVSNHEKKKGNRRDEQTELVDEQTEIPIPHSSPRTGHNMAGKGGKGGSQDLRGIQNTHNYSKTLFTTVLVQNK